MKGYSLRWVDSLENPKAPPGGYPIRQLPCQLILEGCTLDSMQYSGLAQSNCCENCQKVYMERYWSGKIRGRSERMKKKTERKNRKRAFKEAMKEGSDKKKSWKARLAEVVQSEEKRYKEEEAPDLIFAAVYRGNGKYTCSLCKTEALGTRIMRDHLKEKHADELKASKAQIIDETSGDPDELSTIFGSQDGTKWTRITYMPITAEEAMKNLRKAKEGKHLGYKFYKVVKDVNAEERARKSELKKEKRMKRKAEKKAAAGSEKESKKEKKGGRKAGGKTNAQIIFDVIKDKKPHNVKDLAKAIGRPRCVNSLKKLAEGGVKFKEKKGVVTYISGKL